MSILAAGCATRNALLGCITRRERWGLSVRGWLATTALLAAVALTCGRASYSFFAITQRADAPLLVMEGWVHEYAVVATKAEFSAGAYEQVVSTGGPVQGIGGYRNDYSTSASIGAGRLRTAGIPSDLVQMAPSRVIARDRTYHAALALRDWIHARGQKVSAVNVVTEDVHARRTRLLFQMALGDDVTVGVIAVPNPDYDASRWWRYSEGVRDVLGETISYLYAKLFFFPPAPVAPAQRVTGS